LNQNGVGWSVVSQTKIVELIIKSALNDKIKKSICRRVRVLPDKGCWVLSEDWSTYTGLHRQVYAAFVGPLIIGKEICHHCDRRGCINPDHLFQGTHSDNMKDARNKDRIINLQVADGNKELKQIDRWKRLRRFVG